MTPLDTDILADLIHGKHGLLLQLRDLGRRQLELIEANDLTQLLKLLASKQKTIDRAAVDSNADWIRFVAGSGDPRVAHGRRPRPLRSNGGGVRSRQGGDRAGRTNERDSRLTFRRDEAASRLQGVHQASQIRHAYTDGARSSTASTRYFFGRLNRMTQTLSIFEPLALDGTRRFADRVGGMARRDGSAGTNPRSTAIRSSTAHTRIGSQKSRVGPQESIGRLGPDGVAHRARGSQ